MPSLPIAALITASVIATSSTGGNVAGPGTVVRTGNAYASSNVTVVSSGQGTSTIDIRTETNGQVREVRREVSSNDARVEVSVTATSGPAKVEVRVSPPAATSTSSWFKRLFSWGERPHVATTTTASTTASSSAQIGTQNAASATVFTRINAWFKSFFSWFR